MTKCVVVNSLAHGGAERVVSILWNNAFSKDTDCELVLLERVIQYGVSREPIVMVRGGQSKSIYAYLRFVQYFLSVRPRVIQSHLDKPNYLNCLLRIVFRRHNAQVVHCVAYGAAGKNRGIRGWLKRQIGWALFRYADHHIFKSVDMYSDFVEYFGHEPKSYEVINNPYDIREIRKKARQPIDGCFAGYVNLLCVGRLVPEKGYETILRAIAQVNANIHLHILGDGPLRAVLQDLVRQLGIGERVSFYGNVGNPFPFYAKSEIYISGSVAEGFPNALVESMALGCIPIHSDCVSGPREILSTAVAQCDGFTICEYGFLYPVGSVDALTNALVYALENGCHRDVEWLRKIEGSARRFDVELTVQKYEAALQKGLVSV